MVSLLPVGRPFGTSLAKLYEKWKVWNPQPLNFIFFPVGLTFPAKDVLHSSCALLYHDIPYHIGCYKTTLLYICRPDFTAHMWCSCRLFCAAQWIPLQGSLAMNCSGCGPLIFTVSTVNSFFNKNVIIIDSFNYANHFVPSYLVWFSSLCSYFVGLQSAR